jgi:hypothetical protein
MFMISKTFLVCFVPALLFVCPCEIPTEAHAHGTLWIADKNSHLCLHRLPQSTVETADMWKEYDTAA